MNRVKMFQSENSLSLVHLQIMLLLTVTVYADVNDIKPFQKALASGPGGVNDYSRWNFTYTQNYHLIVNGTNELTSKLSCLSSPANLTKWNSVIVLGVMNKNQEQQQEQPIPTSKVNDTTTSYNSNSLKNGKA